MLTRSIRNGMRRQEGQALVMACLLMLVLAIAALTTVNIGHNVSERIRLQNTADSAAYSMAAMEARAFNFYAYANRTQVSHYVSAMMWQSLLKIRNLPMDTMMFCGHEYTAANVHFALSIEPHNGALRSRAEEVLRLAEAGKPTVPTSVASEKTYNPFLRADLHSVAAAINMEGAQPVQVFATIRKRKDQF